MYQYLCYLILNYMFYFKTNVCDVLILQFQNMQMHRAQIWRNARIFSTHRVPNFSVHFSYRLSSFPTLGRICWIASLKSSTVTGGSSLASTSVIRMPKPLMGPKAASWHSSFKSLPEYPSVAVTILPHSNPDMSQFCPSIKLLNISRRPLSSGSGMYTRFARRRITASSRSQVQIS